MVDVLRQTLPRHRSRDRARAARRPPAHRGRRQRVLADVGEDTLPGAKSKQPPVLHLPDVTRIDEPFTGPERGILDGFLDWHRSTLLWKCAGLTGQQLALASVPPSNLSLLGILRHMADVERAWFRILYRGEPLPQAI